MTLVEFLDIKSKLKRKIEHTLATSTGPKSLPSKIKTLADKIPEAKLPSLDTGPSQVLSGLELARLAIEGLLGDLGGIKSQNIFGFRTLVDQKHNALWVQRAAGGDTLDDLELIVGDISRDVNGEKNRLRYIKARAQGQLVRGVFSKEFCIA